MAWKAEQEQGRATLPIFREGTLFGYGFGEVALRFRVGFFPVFDGSDKEGGDGMAQQLFYGADGSGIDGAEQALPKRGVGFGLVGSGVSELGLLQHGFAGVGLGGFGFLGRLRRGFCLGQCCRFGWRCRSCSWRNCRWNTSSIVCGDVDGFTLVNLTTADVILEVSSPIVILIELSSRSFGKDLGNSC